MEDQRGGALVGALAAHILATNADHTLGGFSKARDHPQDRGLATARRPKERKELSGLDVYIHMVNRAKFAKIAAYIIKINPSTHWIVCPLMSSYLSLKPVLPRRTRTANR